MAQPHRFHALARWMTLLAALLIVGPVIGFLTDRIAPIPGSVHGTAIVSASPAVGVAIVVGCIVLATIIGCIGSRMISVGHGLTCAGVALAWSAFRSGHLLDLSRAVDPGALGTRLALEGAIIGIATLAGAILIIRSGPKSTPSMLEGMTSGASIGSMAATTTIGLVVAMLIAQDDKVGQTFAAAVAGSAVGAAAARTLVNGAPRGAALVAIPLGAALCPAVGFALSPHPMDSAILGGSVHALARIMPIDWCAGALIGIPFGLSWAGSMIEKAHPDPKQAGRPVTSRA